MHAAQGQKKDHTPGGLAGASRDRVAACAKALPFVIACTFEHATCISSTTVVHKWVCMYACVRKTNAWTMIPTMLCELVGA